MSLNLKWPGSGSAIVEISGSTTTSMGLTPFGIYDLDTDFYIDAPKTAGWCAKRLGYPIVDVEMIDEQFYACFEESVSEYSAQVNQFNLRNNLDILKGQPKTARSNYSQTLVDGSFLPTTIRMSQQYGTLAGVGGNTSHKKAYIELVPGQQKYDLMNASIDLEMLDASGSASASFATMFTGPSTIDVVKVYYEATPAIQRFFDPYSVGGQGTLNLMDEMGFGSYSPAAQFLLMPLYEDVLRIQAIELNDHIRKSAHTFNIVNNVIEVFPLPKAGFAPTRLYFDYMSRDEFEHNSQTIQSDSLSDYSDIPYDFIQYSFINDVGKQWIRKYTLALAKELLGAIREKYNSIPIPDGEVSLDGAALRAEAQVEKDMLVTQLRENLEELSRKNVMENKSHEADHQQEMLRKVPLKIYVG
jgi:hypothetical protein